jgi:hypothetical protein
MLQKLKIGGFLMIKLYFNLNFDSLNFYDTALTVDRA